MAVGDFTRESGAVAMRQLLTTTRELDAVFVASDLMAHGALQHAARRPGRRVPDDVAVVGFDDIEIARYTDPPLTTVRQPILELGRRAGPPAAAHHRRARRSSRPSSCPTELVVRGISLTGFGYTWTHG